MVHSAWVGTEKAHHSASLGPRVQLWLAYNDAAGPLGHVGEFEV